MEAEINTVARSLSNGGETAEASVRDPGYQFQLKDFGILVLHTEVQIA